MWPTLSSRGDQLSSVEAGVAMIFHSSFYISFKRRLSLWSCPNSNMGTAFVGLIIAAKLSSKKEIQGSVSRFAPKIPDDISTTKLACLHFRQIGVPKGYHTPGKCAGNP